MSASDSQRPSRAPSAGNGAPTERPAREPPRPAVDRLVTGTLVAHGPAPFQNAPNGAPSYFITVTTDHGERTLWGRDIGRALKQSRTKPRVGDAVGVRENGIDPGTFVLRVHDGRGRVTTETRSEAPRPHWIIERRDFFNERAAAARVLRDERASRHEAVRNHPDLVGAYWALDSAAKIAETRIAHPKSRQRFIALVRETLAHATERGEPLPGPVQKPAAAKAPSPRGEDELTR